MVTCVPSTAFLSLDGFYDQLNYFGKQNLMLLLACVFAAHCVVDIKMKTTGVGGVYINIVDIEEWVDGVTEFRAVTVGGRMPAAFANG